MAVRSRPQLRSSWKLIAAGTKRVSLGEGRGPGGLTVLQREPTHLRVPEHRCLSLTSLNEKKRRDLSRRKGGGIWKELREEYVNRMSCTTFSN